MNNLIWKHGWQKTSKCYIAWRKEWFANCHAKKSHTLTRFVIFLTTSTVVSRPLSLLSVGFFLVSQSCRFLVLSSSISVFSLSGRTLLQLVTVPFANQLCTGFFSGIAWSRLCSIMRRCRPSWQTLLLFSHRLVSSSTAASWLRVCGRLGCSSSSSSSTSLAELELQCHEQLHSCNLQIYSCFRLTCLGWVSHMYPWQNHWMLREQFFTGWLPFVIPNRCKTTLV